MAATHSVTGPHDVHLHPAINGGAVGLISADNPAHKEKAEMLGHEAMARELDKLGYEYEPTRGAYGAKERSYIVHNPKLEDLMDLGRKFGQEAVVYSVGGKHFGIYTNGDGLVGKYSPGEGHSFSETEPDNFYTAIPTQNGDAGYFAYNIDWDTKHPFDHSLASQAHSQWEAAKPNEPKQLAAEANGGLVKKSVSAPEAAVRIIKAAVDAYHSQLLELRKKELAKQEPVDQLKDAGFFDRKGVTKGELEKGMFGTPATAAGGARQASFNAARPAVPAPKAVPKPPSAYDAAAFQPTGPVSSGLELDTPKGVRPPVKKEEKPMSCNKCKLEKCNCAAKKEVVAAKTKAAQGGQSGKGPHPAFSGIKKEEKAPGAGKAVIPGVAAGTDPKEVKGGSEMKNNATASSAGAPIEGGAKPKAHPQGFAGSPLLALMKEQAARAGGAKKDAVVPGVAAGTDPGEVTAGKEINKDEMRINNAAKGGAIAPGSSAAKHPATRHLKNEIEAGKVPAQGGQIAAGKSAGAHPATSKLGKSLFGAGRRFVVSAGDPRRAAPAPAPAAPAAPASVGSGPHTFDAAAWAGNAPGCKQCGSKFANPVQVLLAGESGTCGKCAKANHAAMAGTAPVVKQEMMIDLANANDPAKRLKDVNPAKGTKVPGQVGKETGWNGSKQPEEVSTEESPEVKKGKLGKMAIPAVTAPPKTPKQAPAPGGKPIAPPKVHTAKPAGVPGVPKPPKAPGAVG